VIGPLQHAHLKAQEVLWRTLAENGLPLVAKGARFGGLWTSDLPEYMRMIAELLERNPNSKITLKVGWESDHIFLEIVDTEGIETQVPIAVCDCCGKPFAAGYPSYQTPRGSVPLCMECATKVTVVRSAITRRICNVCSFFKRVKKESEKIPYSAFCLLGQGEGDFSLYIDPCYAENCNLFQEDEENLKLYKLETKLIFEWNRIRSSVFFKHRKGNGTNFITADKLLEALNQGYKNFKEKHRSEFQQLESKCMTEEEYNNLLSSLTKLTQEVSR